MNQASDAPRRPLSPFLIYRWGVSNSLSILHRVSGVFMSLGTLVLACWLLSVASGAESYANIASFYGSAWFKLPFTGWALCFFYHLGNGIRHLVWDTGRGFSHAAIRAGGYAVVIFAIVATLLYAAFGIV
jgi:succinate dehydrogenase / fumarate reductase cytochrome b subunit